MDLRREAELVEHLERARHLGFLGPGPVQAHIQHAESFLPALDGVAGSVVDLGSGGGVPGLVLGLARPDLRMVLIDARSVRCRFLEEAVAALGLEATVVDGRAEVIGRSEWRGRAAAVVARSFGPPAATAECAAPLLTVGGRLVVSEPPPPIPTDRWPPEGLAALGLVVGARLGEPAVQVLEQAAPCPEVYPRREGMPIKRPLF